MDNALKVSILYTEGCPSTPKTIELVAECVSDLGIDAELRKVLVTSQEEADKLRFLGSPTIQINGIDIEPSVRDRTTFGFM